MCSIGGFVSSKPLPAATARDLCRGLLWYGQNRGSQSSGVYVNGRTVKRAMAPADFIETAELWAAFDKPVSMALTHTRQPTCGGTGDDQAQPFRVNDVASVHNGMLWDWHSLKKQWDILKKSGVDSELVARFAATYGVQRLPEFVASSNGPSAIAMIQAGEMYLLRDGNPIEAVTITMQDKSKLTVFGSEAQQVRGALQHVWLMPPGFGHRINETKECVLIHVTGEGLDVISKPVRRKFQSWVYQGEDFKGRSWNGCESWSDAQWAEWLAKEKGRDNVKMLPSDSAVSRRERKRERRLRRAMERGGELYLGHDTRTIGSEGGKI